MGICKTFEMFQVTSTLLLVCLLVFASDANASKLRRKRDIIQLGRMIYCTHGWSLDHWTDQLLPFKAIAKYNNYGCFCGVITGGQPKDNLDDCCKKHDDCYEHVFKKYNLAEYFFEMYMNEYDFECDHEAKNITCNLPKKDDEEGDHNEGGDHDTEDDHDGGDDNTGTDDHNGGDDNTGGDAATGGGDDGTGGADAVRRRREVDNGEDAVNHSNSTGGH